MKRRIMMIMTIVLVAAMTMFALSACRHKRNDVPGGDVTGGNEIVTPGDDGPGGDGPSDPAPAPHTHVYGEWHVTTPATCTTDGEEQRECTSGDDVEKRKVNMLGHDYDMENYSADETGHYHACVRCGDKKDFTSHTIVDDYECSVCAWHEDGTTSLGYLPNDDGGYTVTGASNKNLTKIVIPDTKDGKPVTEIKQNAFRESDQPHESALRQVVFGNNVKTIGYCAFGYTGLESVTVPDSVTLIDQFAFYGSPNLRTVVIGDGDTVVGAYSFQGCHQLKTFTVGNGNAVLQTDIVYDCPALTDIVVGNGDVKFMPYAADCLAGLKNLTVGDGDVFFDTYSVVYCNELVNFTVGEGAAVISDDAFYGCEKLENVTLGSNIAEVGWDAFDLCPSISYTTKNGVNYLGNTAHPYTVLVGAVSKDIASVEMEADTKLIMNRAFYECGQLQSVTFGEHLKKIGRRAFNYCSLLGEAVFRDELVEIEHSVFEYCRALNSVTFGSGIRKIGEFAFDGCDALQTVNIPSLEQWLSIEFAADQLEESANPLSAKNATLYAGGAAVTDVVVPDGVTEIKALAFAGYSKLNSLSVGKDVTEIGVAPLEHCKNVQSLTVAAGNDTFAVEGNCVYDKATATVVLGCSASVIPTSVRAIAANVFRYIPLSATFVIPDSVEEVGKQAFLNCESFTDLTLGVGLKKVASWAFASCMAPINTSVTYHIKDLSKWCGIEFEDYSANPLRWYMANIYAAPHAGEGEAVFNNSGATLTIPEGVTEIKPFVFWNVSTQTLHLPSTVTSIASTAFGRNDNLSSYEVAAGNPVYEVQKDGVVEKDTNTLILGKVPHSGIVCEGIEKIGDYAFAGKIFTNVSIASSVKEIGEHAFDSCRIRTLSLGENVTTIGDRAFFGNETSGEGISTVVIPANVTFIGDSAFYRCGISDLTLGQAVQHIGANAFAFNNNITSVSIPASVNEIGLGAFYCSGLAQATFADTAWTVKDYFGYDATPDFSSPAAVAAALKKSDNTWTKTTA